jgi:hypothetical protein
MIIADDARQLTTIPESFLLRVSPLPTNVQGPLWSQYLRIRCDRVDRTDSFSFIVREDHFPDQRHRHKEDENANPMHPKRDTTGSPTASAFVCCIFHACYIPIAYPPMSPPV